MGGSSSIRGIGIEREGCSRIGLCTNRTTIEGEVMGGAWDERSHVGILIILPRPLLGVGEQLWPLSSVGSWSEAR